jgi:hypothetical protein
VTTFYTYPEQTPGSVSHQRYRPLKIGQWLAEVQQPQKDRCMKRLDIIEADEDYVTMKWAYSPELLE